MYFLSFFQVESVHERKLQFGSPNFIEDDLKMLTEPRKDEFPDGNTEDDLPALLQVSWMMLFYVAFLKL